MSFSAHACNKWVLANRSVRLSNSGGNQVMDQTRTQSPLIYSFLHCNMGRRSMRAKSFGKDGENAPRTHKILPINYSADKGSDWEQVWWWTGILFKGSKECSYSLKADHKPGSVPAPTSTWLDHSILLDKVLFIKGSSVTMKQVRWNKYKAESPNWQDAHQLAFYKDGWVVPCSG